MCRIKKTILTTVFFLCFLGVLLTSCKHQSTEMILEQPRESETDNDAADLQEKVHEESSVSEEKPSYIWIDVSGAVKNPGVYKLKADARVFEAIEAAGGFTEQADLQWLNQALPLKDGEKIQVYTEEETKNMKEEADFSENVNGRQDSGKVNLNTAALDELQQIPGIGEVRARAIIQYREEHGVFQSAEEVQQVPGIKGKTYEKMTDYICVE